MWDEYVHERPRFPASDSGSRYSCVRLLYCQSSSIRPFLGYRDGLSMKVPFLGGTNLRPCQVRNYFFLLHPPIIEHDTMGSLLQACVVCPSCRLSRRMFTYNGEPRRFQRRIARGLADRYFTSHLRSRAAAAFSNRPEYFVITFAHPCICLTYSMSSSHKHRDLAETI
jgi:hypothetical protein